jgi:hypothetical protein
MNISTLLFWVLAAAPVPQADADATPTPAEDSTPLVVADEYFTQEGHRVRWASATYSLPDGQVVEVVMAADETASGDAYLFVDGETVAHSHYDETDGVVSWTSSEPETGELVAAALAGLSGGVADELLDAFIGSQEFPCSEWGKKALRAGKYVWGSVVMGGAGVCCLATAAGCPLCTVGGWALTEAGSEALEGYCD